MISDEHTSRLADTLWKFKEEDVFCDTTIYAAGGAEIYAHSVVLGAFNTKLRTRLQDSFSQSMHEQCSWNQSRKYRLDLTHFKPLLLNAVLQFVYTGQTEQLEINGVHIESDELKQLFEMLGTGLLPAFPNTVDGNHGERDRSTEEAEHVDMVEEGDVKRQKYEEEQAIVNAEENEPVVHSSNMRVPKTFTLKIPLPKHSNVCSSFMEKAAINAMHETKRKVVSTFTKHKEKNILPADVDSTSVTEGDGCTQLDVKDSVIKVETETESGSKFDGEVKESSRVTRQNSRMMRKCRIERQSSSKFQCCLCSNCFTHKTHLQDHLKTHADSEPYACKLCEKTFTQGSLLSRHYLAHCCEDLQELKNTEFESLVAEISKCQFSCNESEKDFSSVTQLKRHATTRATDQRFQCPKCDRSFQKRVHLLKHEMTHTEVGPNACVVSNKIACSELTEHSSTPVGIQPLVCNACGKQFDSHEAMKRHESVHLVRKIYHCQVCNKNFKCLSYLKSHQKGHDGIKPFMCDVCGKGFLGSSNLKTHRRIHTGERPYACSYCEKRFLQICAVKEHEKIHLGNKQFVCDTCGKMFMTYAQLYNHLKIHNGIKAFECDICNKKFFTNGDLTKHQRIHKDQRPFVCKVCGKGFKYSSNLHGHSRIHSGVRPYVCKTCGKDFTYSSHLSRHLKLHTREKILAAEKECDYAPVAIPNHHIQATHISLPTIFIDRPNVDTNFTSGFTTYTGFNMHLCN